MTQKIDNRPAASSRLSGLYDQATSDDVAELIQRSSKEERKVARGIGKAYDEASEAYMNAIKSGDQEEILEKKTAFEKASLALQTFVQMTSNAFQIMLSVIRKTEVR